MPSFHNDKASTQHNSAEISRDFWPWDLLPGMGTKKFPSLLQPAREPDVERKAEQDAGTACRREDDLLSAMPIIIALSAGSLPRNRTHAGCGDGPEDLRLRHIAGPVGHRHPPIQDIEREAILSSDDGPDCPPENGDFLGTIQAAHPISTPAVKGGRLRSALVVTAASYCVLVLSAWKAVVIAGACHLILFQGRG